MKTTFPFIILILNFIYSSGQDSLAITRGELEVSGNLYSQSYGVKRYDSEGHLIKAEKVGRTFDAYYPQSYGEYVNYYYDLNWNLITDSNFLSIDTLGYALNSVHHYYYDLNDELTIDSLFDFKLHILTTVDRDANNDTITIDRFQIDSTSYIFYDKWEITRDAFGRAILREYYFYSPTGIPILKERRTCTYDINGNVILFTIQSINNTVLTETYRQSFQYSSSGQLEIYGFRGMNFGIFSLLDTANYQFNAAGNISQSLQINYFTGTPDSTITINTYDNNNFLIQTDINEVTSVSGIPTYTTYRYLITRDPIGQPIDSTCQQYISGVYQNTNLFLFDYTQAPSTIDRFEIECPSGLCNDTVKLTKYTFGNFGGYLITYYSFNSGVPTYLSSTGIEYNSTGKVLSDRTGSDGYNYYFQYDVNDNLIYSDRYHYPLNHKYEHYSWVIDTVNILTVSINFSDTISCQRSPNYGLITISGGYPPYSINWNDTLNILYPNSEMPIFFPDSNTMFILTVTDSIGQQISTSFTLRGNNHTLSLFPTTACIGDTLVAIVSPPLSGNYLYSLVEDGSVISTSNQPIFVIPFSSNFQIQVNTSCANNVRSNEILILPLPFIQLGADRVLCLNDSIQLNIPSSDSILWNDGSNSSQFIIHNPGTYFCTLIDSNQCSSTDTISVIGNSIAPPTLGPDTTICINQSIILNAGTNFTSYLWQNGDSGPFFNYTSSVADTMLATVIVTDSNNCIQSDSISIIVDICTNTNNLHGDLISIGPNPCHEILNIYNIFQQIRIGSIRIQILDMTGRVVEMIDVTGSEYSVKIDVTHLENGIYLIKLSSNDFSSSAMFVKN